jgi:hypothetical protein
LAKTQFDKMLLVPIGVIAAWILREGSVKVFSIMDSPAHTVWGPCPCEKYI